MTARGERWARWAVVVLVAAAVVLGARVFLLLASDRSPPGVTSDAVALAPGDAIIRAAPGEVVAVRGWVVDEGGLLSLCTGVRDTPPVCVGPSLLLVNLDVARVPLEDVDGSRRSPDPLVVAGTVDGTRLVVTELLADR